MGRYATTTSISNIAPNWLSGNTTTSDANATDMWSATADRAEGYVNAALVSRYDPSGWTTTTIPPLVRKLAEDITCFWAFRGSSVQDSQIKNQNLETWKQAFDILKEIQEGGLKLADTGGSLVVTRSSGRFLNSTQDYTPISGLDDEDKWKRDPDEIDDQAAARD